VPVTVHVAHDKCGILYVYATQGTRGNTINRATLRLVLYATSYDFQRSILEAGPCPEKKCHFIFAGNSAKF